MKQIYITEIGDLLIPSAVLVLIEICLVIGFNEDALFFSLCVGKCAKMWKWSLCNFMKLIIIIIKMLLAYVV